MKRQTFFLMINVIIIGILITNSHTTLVSDSDPDSPFFKAPSQLDVRSYQIATSLSELDPKNSTAHNRPHARQSQRNKTTKNDSQRGRFPDEDFQPHDHRAQQYRQGIMSGLNTAQTIELESILPEQNVFAENPAHQKIINMPPPQSLQQLRLITYDPQNDHILRRRQALVDNENHSSDNLITGPQQIPAQHNPAMVPLIGFTPQPPSPRQQLIRQNSLLEALLQQRTKQNPATNDSTAQPVTTLHQNGSFYTLRRGGVVDQHHNTRPNVSPSRRQPPIFNTTPLPEFTETDESSGTDESSDSEFTIDTDIFTIPTMNRSETVPFGKAILEYRAQESSPTTTAFSEELRLPLIPVAAQRRYAISRQTPQHNTRTVHPSRPNQPKATPQTPQQQFQEHLNRARHHNDLPPVNPMKGHTRGI